MESGLRILLFGPAVLEAGAGVLGLDGGVIAQADKGGFEVTFAGKGLDLCQKIGQLPAGEPIAGVSLQDFEQAIIGLLVGWELFGGIEGEEITRGEEFVGQVHFFTLLVNAKSRLVGAFGSEAVFELAEKVEGTLPLQAPGEIHIGDDIRGAAHAVLIGAGFAQFTAIEHLDLAPRGGALVEVMQDEDADAVGVELDLGEGVEKAQGRTNAGDVVIGHVGEVAREDVEDDQAGRVGLEAIQEAGDGAGVADVEGVEVEGDVFTEQIFFIGRQAGGEGLQAATEVIAGGILAVVDDGQGWLGGGLPGRAGGGEANGEIER